MRTSNLNDNKLVRIESNTFQLLVNLVEVKISCIYLNHIEPDAFVGLVNFNKLFLKHGRLSELAENAFFVLEKLTHLHLTQLLNYNLKSIIIEFLKPHQFKGMLNLQYLSLPNNQIQKIQEDAFDDLNWQLQLGHNHLTSLDSKMFSSMINLNQLHFFHNNIENIENDFFDNLIKLTRKETYREVFDDSLSHSEYF